MTNPLRSSASHCLGLLLARVPLGILFVLAGVSKFRMGVGEFVTKSADLVPKWTPPALGNYYLHALPSVEILVGALAVLGLLGRLAGLLMTLILISIMIATGVDPKGGPLNPNFIYLGIALMLFFTGPGHISVDGMLCGKKRAPSTPEK